MGCRKERHRWQRGRESKKNRSRKGKGSCSLPSRPPFSRVTLRDVNYRAIWRHRRRRDTPLDISILENCAANRMLRVRVAHASSSGRSSRRYTYIHARGPPPRARANTRVCLCVCVAISSKLQYKGEIECNELNMKRCAYFLNFCSFTWPRIERYNSDII